MYVTELPRAFIQEQSIYCWWYWNHFYDIFFLSRMYVFYPLFVKVVPPKWLPLFKESSLERLHFPSETTDTCGKHLLVCPWRLRHCCKQHSFVPAVLWGSCQKGRGYSAWAGQAYPGRKEAELLGLEEWEGAGWVNFLPSSPCSWGGCLALAC